MSTGSQTDCPLPKRVSLRSRLAEDAPVSAHARSNRVNRRGAGRSRARVRWSGAAVTTGILTATFVGPAAASSPADSHDDGRVAGKFGVESSWADVKSNDGALTAADLNRDPAAASRARYRVPVEVAPCKAQVDVAANGSRQMTTQETIYMPLREGTFAGTSYYGYRIHPILGYSKLHEGDDYSAPVGTPIYAVADGVVKTAQWDGNRGFYTVIEHTLSDGTKFESWYQHQTESMALVAPGQTVSAGQQIGGVGSTGLSTGAHLHFEIHDASGASVAPSYWMQDHGAAYLGEGC